MHESADTALDRRVERLEQSQAQMQAAISQLSSDVRLLAADTSHVREMMNARFTSVEAAIAATSGKLDQLILMGQQVSSDPSLTPAGKAIMKVIENNIKEIDGLRTQVEEQDDWRVEVQGQLKLLKWITGGGLVSLIVLVAKLVVGLPPLP